MIKISLPHTRRNGRVSPRRLSLLGGLVLVILVLLIAPKAIVGQGDFPISAGAGDQIWPTVAYNSQDDEYLVAWEDHSGQDIALYVRRVSTAGVPLGDAVAIATASQGVTGM